MHITVNSQILAQELRAVNRVTPAKPAIPILTHVLIRAADQKAIFWSTDLEVGLSTECASTVTVPGAVALPAKRLLDMVEQFTNADVHIVQDTTSIQIQCGGYKSRLQAMPTADFPVEPVVEGAVSVFSADALHAVIGQTKYAISDKSTKYVLDGALLSLTPTGAYMVTTDGKRLAVATMAYAGVKWEGVLPSKTLDALTSFGEGDIEFSCGPRHTFFRCADQRLTSRMLDGKFPAWNSMVPKSMPYKMVLARDVFTAALRRVGIVSDQGAAVTFTLSATELVMTSQSAEIGDAAETVPTRYDGPSMTCTINNTYVLDFLNAAKGDEIVVAIRDAVSPLLVSDGNTFLNVILLMASAA